MLDEDDGWTEHKETGQRDPILARARGCFVKMYVHKRLSENPDDFAGLGEA